MSAQYAFFFDARFCSGCKACQAACKDKNNLPPGILWRRVMEVSGGAWQQEGAVWNNTVFAYNLSLSCNHCHHPKCAGICPTNAFVIREDGIVILDESRCMGCGYCAWGCPYGVPQYNPDAGHMTKCDFCFDQLDNDLPPACVAACPLRVLDYQDTTLPAATGPNEIRLWEAPSATHPFPLPVYSHTQPRLAIQQHAAMYTKIEKYLANNEEIHPRPLSSWEEFPLLLFTLLSQMAIGGVWIMAWVFQPLWSLVQFNATILKLIPILLVGLCLGAGMLASLAHLGNRRNAWRVFSNLRRSSLSKEVLFTGIFGLGLFLTFLSVILQQDVVFWLLFTSAGGLGLVYNMAQVYRFPAAPGWNTWRTNASFVVSSLLLGFSAMIPLLAGESSFTSLQVSAAKWTTTSLGFILLLVAQLTVMHKQTYQSPLHKIRIGLILCAVAVSTLALFQSGSDVVWLAIVVPVLVVTEEILGRWLFYRSRM
jgi:anaerobic dimethyl sulfoxide reductase subunit B (iron-sulfur subunit)